MRKTDHRHCPSCTVRNRRTAGHGGDTMADETFGQALRRLRGSRSLRNVAQLAKCGKSTVYDLEHDLRLPTPELAQALDHAVGAGGELASFVRDTAPQRQSSADDRHPLMKTMSWVDYSPLPFDDPTDWDCLISLVESQLPQHYTAANFFGSRSVVHTVLHHAITIRRVLQEPDNHRRGELLRIGARIAEFAGWLLQDLGEFEASLYWSDRSMEWAQEADDSLMQSYVLYRKSNQAHSRGSAQQAVGLAHAAQRLPNLTPHIKALAVQQEAQGHAAMGKPKTALTKFDEALLLASEPSEAPPKATLDVTYCTPTYIAMQRANSLIGLGNPKHAIAMFEGEIAALPKIYRNDQSVYLARLARAYTLAGEPERGAEVAGKSLALVAQTASQRALTELAAVNGAMEPQQDVAGVKTFREHYRLVRDRTVRSNRAG